MIKISKISRYLQSFPINTYDVGSGVHVKNTYTNECFGQDLKFQFNDDVVSFSDIRLFNLGELPKYTANEQSPSKIELAASRLRLLHSLIDFEVEKNHD